MVVVSWPKNVATYPLPTISAPDMVVRSNSKIMTARAVLISRPNSHPFEERTLTLDQPVKVGRFVARARPTSTNAIFDCKVLSRHHALLWFEKGKFYLQDTKSSNGTFVNNVKLAPDTEIHEVSSGDVVQFGVDVIENNRKVTHGCIIAILRLYLPDGKEAKPSPSISENSSNVPLDELYKLHQIIQEATQREQCLETKLCALQSVVDEARKSAEASWQAYVGEERLLSRISALETQLQQHNSKNWSEDKLREEITKLQNESATYQIAAKEALEKLHAERLQAISLATEQERSRISAEQELLLLKEQQAQTQRELEEVAQKLQEENKRSQEEVKQLEQQQWELKSRLDTETEKVTQLKTELDSFSCKENAPPICDLEDNILQKHIIYNDDVKMKEEMIENDNCDSKEDVDMEQQPKQNHINLTVAPVEGEVDINKNSEENLSEDDTSTVCDFTIEKRRSSFNIPENLQDMKQLEEKVDEFDNDGVDSKTLKYKYQTVQNELKQEIERLQSMLESKKTKISELEKSLGNERETNQISTWENQSVKEKLESLQEKYRESCEENEDLKKKVFNHIQTPMDQKNSHSPSDEKPLVKKTKNISAISSANSDISLSYENFVCLEEELVLLKERYAQMNDEKSKLVKDLQTLKEQYNKICNRSYDKMYFYILPLFIILYLLISAMIS